MVSELRVSWATLLVSFAAASGLAAQTAPPRPVERDRKNHTALVVLIAIDQMRPDYFGRFGAQFSGGLGRILNGTAAYPWVNRHMWCGTVAWWN